MAFILRENAFHDAHADFWLAVAVSLSDSDSDLLDTLRSSWIELNEELELAEAQFEARLEACARFGHAPYDPQVNSTDFSIVVDNPYMPFIQGRILVYEKHTAEGIERIEVSTLRDTAVIDNVECLAVREYETFNGVLVEESINWIAQHKNGDVWYFGEISKIYEDGFLETIEGSWRSGTENAKPGILMPGTPIAGKIYRQEFLLTVAEDIAEVVALNGTVTVPVGTFDDCVTTEEVSPIEPEDDMQKSYAPGVGLLQEVDMQNGGSLKLVQIIN